MKIWILLFFFLEGKILSERHTQKEYLFNLI